MSGIFTNNYITRPEQEAKANIITGLLLSRINSGCRHLAEGNSDGIECDTIGTFFLVSNIRKG